RTRGRRSLRLLRAEIGGEAADGFPRLRRIPQTDLIWFLDHFAALAPADREPLLDALARFGAGFFPDQGPQQLPELEARYPAFARFRAGRNGPGFRPGYRYTDVKTLSTVARTAELGGLEGWIAGSGAAGLALQPREDLLPDVRSFRPALAAALRKLVDGAFARAFTPEKKKLAGGAYQYAAAVGGGRLT